MAIINDREAGGKQVRKAWICWAKTQADSKPSWLRPWEQLDEQEKEADRQIWEVIAQPYIAHLKELIQRNADLHQQVLATQKGGVALQMLIEPLTPDAFIVRVRQYGPGEPQPEPLSGTQMLEMQVAP